MAYWAADDYNGPRARGSDVEPISAHRHPSQHNLSPVKGAREEHGGVAPWKGHGTPEEHKVYAEHYAKKADWHYKRWGNPRQPQATLAKAGVADFKSQVARGWPK